VEVRTKIISLSAFLSGTLYAISVSGTVEWIRVVLMALAVLAVDMATTGFNTFYDYWSGVDRRETNREIDKVLVHQNVAPGLALIVSLALYTVALVLGLVLSIIVGPVVALTGAICLVVGFLYNGGPRPISGTPFGELFAGGFLGWVLVSLSIYVHNSSVAPSDLLLGVPSLFLVGSILTVNNTCDIHGDTASGRRTLSILLGRYCGEALIYGLGLLGFISASLLRFATSVPAVTSFTVPAAMVLSFPVYLRMHRRGFSHATKSASMQSVSLVFVLYSLSIIVPLAVAAVRASAGDL
jgi:1,4-dihydroxy-2-naphthoate polyprenyltransferase